MHEETACLGPPHCIVAMQALKAANELGAQLVRHDKDEVVDAQAMAAVQALQRHYVSECLFFPLEAANVLDEARIVLDRRGATCCDPSLHCDFRSGLEHFDLYHFLAAESMLAQLKPVLISAPIALFISPLPHTFMSTLQTLLTSGATRVTTELILLVPVQA